MEEQKGHQIWLVILGDWLQAPQFLIYKVCIFDTWPHYGALQQFGAQQPFFDQLTTCYLHPDDLCAWAHGHKLFPQLFP